MATAQRGDAGLGSTDPMAAYASRACCSSLPTEVLRKVSIAANAPRPRWDFFLQQEHSDLLWPDDRFTEGSGSYGRRASRASDVLCQSVAARRCSLDPGDPASPPS